jgi:hypothetical protein
VSHSLFACDLFCTLSRGLVFISNANPACSCVYICKFQFRPIHPPPLGDYHPRPRPHSRGEDKLSKPKNRGPERGWQRRSRRRRGLLQPPAPSCPPRTSARLTTNGSRTLPSGGRWHRKPCQSQLSRRTRHAGADDACGRSAPCCQSPPLPLGR